MTATDWTAEKVAALEAELLAVVAQIQSIVTTGTVSGLNSRLIEHAALALQTQRNLLAAANARIAELEAAGTALKCAHGVCPHLAQKNSNYCAAHQPQPLPAA